MGRKWFLKLLGLTIGVSVPAELFSQFVWDIEICCGVSVVEVVSTAVWSALFCKLLLGKEKL